MAEIQGQLELAKHLNADIGLASIGAAWLASEIGRHIVEGEAAHFDRWQSHSLVLVQAAYSACHADRIREPGQLRLLRMIFLGQADRTAIANVERGIDRRQAAD